jgi:hypothetical protein
MKQEHPQLHVVQDQDGTSVWIDGVPDEVQTGADVLDWLAANADAGNARAALAYDLATTHPHRGLWWSKGGTRVLLVDG